MQYVEGGDWVLQVVGYYQGDVIVFFELQFVQQIGGELFDQGVGFIIGEYFVEIGVGGVVMEFGY